MTPRHLVSGLAVGFAATAAVSLLGCGRRPTLPPLEPLDARVQAQRSIDTLRLELVPLTIGVQKYDQTFAFEVSLRNVTTEPMFVCWDTRGYPTGFLRLRVYDEANRQVRLGSQLLADHIVSPERDGVTLDPGASVKEELRLAANSVPRTGSCTEYKVIAEYSCRFYSPPVGDSGTIVASGSVWSLPVRVVIDSRRWWQRAWGIRPGGK